MSDLEHRLRALSVRAMEHVPALSPNDRVLRRIRRRRSTVVVTAALSLLLVVAGGVYASTNLFGDGTRPRPVPVASDVGSCFPLEFEPTYLPPGFTGSSSRPSDEDTAFYYGTSKAAFIQVSPYPIPGIARVDREQLRVLGRPAELATIHEGFIVSFTHGDCHYDAEAYGVKRLQLRRFAVGLTVPGGEVRFEQLYESERDAIWPQDTRENVLRACRTYREWRSRNALVALAFVLDVLGWSGDRAPSEFEMDVDGRDGEVLLRTPGSDGLHGAVQVYTTQLVPGCWSVSSVSRPPGGRPAVVNVQIQGRTARIGFAPSFEAASAIVEVGYGGRNRRTTWRPTDDGPATIRLDFDPDTDGHYLVLLRDEQGRVFSALGGPLPPGDYAGLR